jgi:transcriptional regulator
MHPAPGFLQADEAVLLDHLARYPFATLASAPAGRPIVAHAPVLARRLDDGLVLDFHLSRGNALTPFLADGFPAVAVSLAADAYVSPDWYESQGAVPTWNYASVEVEGPVTAMDDDGLVALLDDLSAQEEARLAPKPIWTRAKMAPGRFETMYRSIIGARLKIERLEGTFKLSQNKDAADRVGVMNALGDAPIVSLMRAAIPPR